MDKIFNSLFIFVTKIFHFLCRFNAILLHNKKAKAKWLKDSKYSVNIWYLKRMTSFHMFQKVTVQPLHSYLFVYDMNKKIIQK